MKKFNTLFKTEFKLSLRGMNMAIFAVGMPLIITIVLGFIYGNKPAFDGASYTMFQQSFGAMSSIGIFAAGVMGLPLTLADYRNKKILKRLQVTPVKPALLLNVQIAVNAVYSLMSLLLIYAIFKIFGYSMTGNVLAFAASYVLVLLSIYSIGMTVAAVAPSVNSAGLICSILYFPMLVFSGATIPFEIMPKGLRAVADFLPLTQAIKLLKGASLGFGIKEMILPASVLAGIFIICTLLSVKFFKWDYEKNN